MTPTCPGCGAKFAFSQALQACTKCGITAEVMVGGKRALERWRKGQGLKPRPGTFQRRKRAHGRPRGKGKRVNPAHTTTRIHHGLVGRKD